MTPLLQNPQWIFAVRKKKIQLSQAAKWSSQLFTSKFTYNFIFCYSIHSQPITFITTTTFSLLVSKISVFFSCWVLLKLFMPFPKPIFQDLTQTCLLQEKSLYFSSWNSSTPHNSITLGSTAILKLTGIQSLIIISVCLSTTPDYTFCKDKAQFFFLCFFLHHLQCFALVGIP